ncbi:hypothetical protein [Pseudomonas sp. GV085]|uniref:hypothetical protein n=1 Tax=Pseudomonas sp. GV085 TaxID=2135756 RepID=UPI0011B27DE7|nr:hypothetical protein [Pseudomonas sp. GV085]
MNKNILLQAEIFRNIRAAFTTTVYAFLDPRRPSAAWDFFCLKFGVDGEDQKIAGYASSYGDVRLAFVGAAAGCDLLCRQMLTTTLAR